MTTVATTGFAGIDTAAIDGVDKPALMRLASLAFLSIPFWAMFQSAARTVSSKGPHDAATPPVIAGGPVMGDPSA